MTYVAGILGKSMRRFRLPMLIGWVALILLALEDRGLATEPPIELLDGRDARIDELEQAVAGLQQQIEGEATKYRRWAGETAGVS